jgi:Leucine-rich repeat (LRR) protein
MKLIVVFILLNINFIVLSQTTFKDLDQALKFPDSVITLDLSKEKLKVFPKDILKFNNIERLILSKNKLDSIPDLSTLKNLTFLDLEKNKFTEINTNFAKLLQLEVLKLGLNEIETIPEFLISMKNLQVLDLWSNPITFFSDKLSEFPSLKVLDLSNIPFSKEEHKRVLEVFKNIDIRIDDPCDCMDDNKIGR